MTLLSFLLILLGIAWLALKGPPRKPIIIVIAVLMVVIGMYLFVRARPNSKKQPMKNTSTATMFSRVAVFRTLY